MATIALNPVFTSISGTVGRMVFYKRNNRTIARAWVMPPNPNTPAQQRNRSLFRQAMDSWKALSNEEKAGYNRRAGKLSMSGHNLYVSWYMKEQKQGSHKNLREQSVMTQTAGSPDTIKMFTGRGRSFNLNTHGRDSINTLPQSSDGPHVVLNTAGSPQALHALVMTVKIPENNLPADVLPYPDDTDTATDTSEPLCSLCLCGLPSSHSLHRSVTAPLSHTIASFSPSPVGEGDGGRGKSSP